MVSELLVKSERVDRLFAIWKKRNSPGCALAVLQDGKTLYTRGYGLAQIEYGIRNTPTTVFHIASVSKQFTNFAIHLLAQAGKLSLEDDVRKYLPELHDFGKTITIRHLIHHMSGLRDQWDLLVLAGWRMEDVITEQDILRMVWLQTELNFAPGDEDLYCNTGYTLLGIIVKRVSGQSLSDFSQTTIFKPLGMDHTHFQDQYSTLVTNRAYSYAPDSPGKYRYVALSYSNVGATSLFSTVEDLARWDENFYQGSVGGEAVLAAMHQQGRLNDGKEISYASGLNISAYRGLKTVAHGGADAAFRSYLLRFPEQRFSVILLANAGELNPVGLAHKVADIFLEGQLEPAPLSSAPTPQKQPAKPRAVKLDPKILDAYAGDYELFPGFLLTFTREDDQLMMQATGQEKNPLFPASETKFFLKGVDIQVTFSGPKEGSEPPTAILHQYGREMSAKRIERLRPTSEQLAEYTGEFYSPELKTLYTVAQRQGKLFLRDPRNENEITTSAEADLFNTSHGALRFTRDAVNGCTGFTLSTGRVRNLRFIRVELKPTSTCEPVAPNGK